MTDSVKLNLDFKLVNETTDRFLLKEDDLPLSQLLPRIIKERGGSFFDITEEEITREIDQHLKVENKDNDTESKDDFSTEVETVGVDDSNLQTQGSTGTLSSNEQFYRNKHELLKNIQLALNESSLSLDFISLLISCVRPAAGTVSMSQHLKKFVGAGSLNADKVKDTMNSFDRGDRFREIKAIGLGWKLASLENSSNSLRDSSLRLSEEVFKEKVFWDTINKNLNTKEILFKTREKKTNKKVLAVKFGYGDSGSTFNIEGNAIIKTTNAGKVQFIPIDNKPILNKTIRIRILAKDSTIPDDTDYVIVGQSQVSDEIFNTNEEENGSTNTHFELKSQIEQARYLIFEEELFNQLMEEATSLISYNVKIENESKITIEVNHQIIEITYQELPPLEETPNIIESETKPQDQRTELIATYLRLMLTLKHQSHLQSKNQTKILKPSINVRQTNNINQNNLHQQPPSNTQQQTILKPLVGQFRHDFILTKLHSIITRLLGELNQAQTTTESKLSFKLLKAKHNTNLQKTKAGQPTPPVSQFKIKIPNSESRVLVVLDSFDFVNFVILVKILTKDERPKEFRFEDLRGVDECLEWIIGELLQNLES